MFAPFYRQYDAAAMIGFSSEQLLAVESGAHKKDSLAAFDYYFTYLNNGRPYILCGHSQGAIMLNFILSEYMQMHQSYYENMIAAYMIGYVATKAWLTKNPHIEMAQRIDDVGVVICKSIFQNNMPIQLLYRCLGQKVIIVVIMFFIM